MKVFLSLYTEFDNNKDHKKYFPVQQFVDSAETRHSRKKYKCSFPTQIYLKRNLVQKHYILYTCDMLLNSGIILPIIFYFTVKGFFGNII